MKHKCEWCKYIGTDTEFSDFICPACCRDVITGKEEKGCIPTVFHESGKAREIIDLIEMANLEPRRTGLSVYIWLDEFGKNRKAKHRIPRLKVAEDNPSDLIATVSIEETPRLLNGKLNNLKLHSVKKWISMNLGTLLKHWNREYDIGDVLDNMIDINGNKVRRK